MSSTTNTVYTSKSLIDMLPSEPSICVPRIYMNITKERVYDVFADLFGHQAIERVDMIERTNKEGESYKRAFVHFKAWPRTPQSTEVRLKLLNGDEVKIVYDQPWYWRISASRLPRPEEQQKRRKEQPVSQRPFIIIEENEDGKDVSRRQQHANQQAHQDRRYQEPREYHHERREQQQQRPREYHDRRYQEPREYHHERREQRPREYHDRREREQRPREYHDRRPSRLMIDEVNASFVTPKKPEIAAWVDDKTKVNAPKGKKPRLVINDDEEDKVKQVTRPRRLSFDECSSGDVQQQQQVDNNSSSSSSTEGSVADK